MAVTRKPAEEQTRQESVPDSPAFQDYLHKGGSAAHTPQQAPRAVRFTLHIPGPLCQELDQLRERRPLKTSRHQWVLEAIWERIQRERKSGTH